MCGKTHNLVHFQRFCVASLQTVCALSLHGALRGDLVHKWWCPGLLCCTQKQFVPIGFLRMEHSRGAISWNLGSSWSSHPVQFHQSIAHSSLESSLEPLSAKEAIAWDDRNSNTDFIVVVIMRSRGKLWNKLMQNKLYCKCWSNQTCSKVPAWLSEQQVKGWNWCLSWAAVLLWPQLLETQETHRFLLRKLDAVIP